jgi:succinate dehydrogenase cytochrome b subunit
MAITGVVLFGFVLGHMAGNLKMYQGREVYNHYAEGLREIGYPIFPHESLLWVARIVLLASVLLHMLAAWRVARQSWAARAQPYARYRFVETDYAARTMRWGGVIIALFVVYHLAHFTWGWAWVHPDFIRGDVYHNVVTGFRSPLVALVYVAANLVLGFHLYHGLWSMLQSLGANHPRYNAWRRHFATVFAFVVTAGNVSFPIAVLTGIIS